MRPALELHPRGSPLPRTSGFPGNVRASVRARVAAASGGFVNALLPGQRLGLRMRVRAKEVGSGRSSAPGQLRRFGSRGSDYSDPQGKTRGGQRAAPWAWLRSEVSWQALPREAASVMTSRLHDVSSSCPNSWVGLPVGRRGGARRWAFCLELCSFSRAPSP